MVETDAGLCRGQTVADWYGKSGEPANVDIVTKVDVEGFFDLFESGLRQLSRVYA
jgi:purine nucleosidase